MVNIVCDECGAEIPADAFIYGTSINPDIWVCQTCTYKIVKKHSKATKKKGKKA